MSPWAHIDALKARHEEELEWFKALAKSVRRSSHPICRADSPSPWRIRFWRRQGTVRVSASSPAEALAKFDAAIGGRS